MSWTADVYRGLQGCARLKVCMYLLQVPAELQVHAGLQVHDGLQVSA